MEDDNKKTVLVVDDDENLRLVLVDKLNISGFKAIGASNGKDGLEKALSLHPDIILLDVIMPIMNGAEMLKKLREDDWGKEAKVVILSAVEDIEIVAQAVQKGSFTYLTKTDQSIDDVILKVKSMLKNN